MEASLDTCILINLYSSGSEDLLFEFFDDLYFFDELYEKELKKVNSLVYTKITKEIENGRIKLVTTKNLIEINMRSEYEYNLSNYKSLLDDGEWKGIALATTLGHEAFLTDDVKEFGPHYMLRIGTIEGIIPFAFYELLYLKFLCNKISAEELHENYDYICKRIKWPVIRKNNSNQTTFGINMKKSIKRFSKYSENENEINWMVQFCKNRDINYGIKNKELYEYLLSIEKNSP